MYFLPVGAVKHDSGSGGFLYKPSHERALELLLDGLPASVPVEEVPLREAVGRVAAEDVRALRPFPANDLSMMDGVALRPGETPEQGSPVRTGEPIPAGAEAVIPVEALDGDDPRSDASTQHVVRSGSEYAAGDEVVPAGAVISHRDVSQLALFGVESVRALRRPRIRVAIFEGRPFFEAVESWMRGLLGSYHEVELSVEPLGAIGELSFPEGGTDLGIVVSDGRPGRYDEIKGLTGGALPGFETLFWKLDLQPCKHVGLGRLRGAPVLVLPDVFFKTALAALAFLPRALASWAGREIGTRPAYWVEPPRIRYPYPCLVPLGFGERRRGLSASATPLRSTFSARWVSAARGWTVLDRSPRTNDEIAAHVLGELR